MPCRYCGERDPFKLSIRTKFINGRVETIEICLDCYWLDRFRCEGEDGNTLQFEEGIFTQSEFYELFRRALQRREG